MKNVELTTTQKSALTAFQSKGQMTQLRLSIVLGCEKALARNVTMQLIELGLVTDYKNGQYNINAAGKAALKIPSGKTTFKVIEDEPAPAKQEPVLLADLEFQQNQRFLAADAAARKIEDEAVHSLPAADTSEPVTFPAPGGPIGETVAVAVVDGFVGDDSEVDAVLAASVEQEPARQVLVVPPEQADQLAEKPTELVELNQAAPADFDTLVRQGLARLNQRLGMQPVHIDKMGLKVETLQALANSIGPVDPSVQELLLLIAADLRMIAARSS